MYEHVIEMSAYLRVSSYSHSDATRVPLADPAIPDSRGHLPAALPSNWIPTPLPGFSRDSTGGGLSFTDPPTPGD